MPMLQLKQDFDVLRHAAFNPLKEAQSVVKEQAPQVATAALPSPGVALPTAVLIGCGCTAPVSSHTD